MPSPSVLVLLAAHNGAAHIADQVETILAQTQVELTLIISDDGSTDDTRSVLRRFAGDARLSLVAPPRPTGAAARNFLWLIQHTAAGRHDFVALADQDDLWSPDKLRRACDRLTACAAAGYSCAVEAFWDDGTRKVLGQRDRRSDSDFLFEGAGQGCTFVLTAEFYGRVRRFLAEHSSLTHSLHYHDWAIYALSRLWNLGWVFDPEPKMRYRQHAHNDTGARRSIAGVRRRLILIQSGWYRRQLMEIEQLCSAAAPAHPTVARWRQLVSAPPAFTRKWRMMLFVCRGGRRRRSDNAVLLAAIIAGWL